MQCYTTNNTLCGPGPVYIGGTHVKRTDKIRVCLLYGEVRSRHIAVSLNRIRQIAIEFESSSGHPHRFMRVEVVGGVKYSLEDLRRPQAGHSLVHGNLPFVGRHHAVVNFCNTELTSTWQTEGVITTVLLASMVGRLGQGGKVKSHHTHFAIHECDHPNLLPRLDGC